MIDIYFHENYGKLYESIENGESVPYIFNCKFGTISHLFIKREIPYKVDSNRYYDLITPFGYGGPLIIDFKENCKQDLISSFTANFENWCKENNIVSEFIRFHPIVKNAIDFKSIYKVSFDRYTVGTNIKDYNKPEDVEFSQSCKRNIKKALKFGLTYKVNEIIENKDIENFLLIYYSTMDRNNAKDYYYFDETYFYNCLKYFPENLITVEVIYDKKIIAMGFYFKFNNIVHIHLSGTLSEYLYLSPAYILRYAVALWAKKNNYCYIHHGGGRSNSEEDGLYKFKKQFGINTKFEFNTGRKIWNKKIYDNLCKITSSCSDSTYFPAYRQCEK
ncbi:MAG: aminoacyltransferase [Bacilli bacterium]|nr:aminoacyltransferase [Bacilli bacterium]